MIAALVLLLVVLGSSLLTGAWTQYATGCPHAEQECELVGWDCVDWDASPSCTAFWIVACGAACAGGGWFQGFACALGCGAIAWELCKFCDEWEFNWVCHCPGGDPPESAIPPVIPDLEDALIQEE